MTIPAALADVMITSEASITVEIDDKLCELERDKDTLRSSASVISTSTEQAERIAGILDEVRFLLGRSDRRLHRLKLLFSASSQYMQDLCNAMPNPKPQDDVEVTKRILEALNNNMRSDVEQLLLQVQNSNVRVQTLQQLVC